MYVLGGFDAKNLVVICALHAIFFLHFVSCKPGYLKFCGDEHKHVVRSTSCSKGLWIKVPMKPGCVCATGVWALSDGLCDKLTAIIVGQDHCFYVGFNVRSVKFIGNPIDPFDPSVYVASGGVDTIYQVPETGLSPSISSDTSMVIGINPHRQLQREDRSFCLQLHKDNSWKPVHIYINPTRSPRRWLFGSRERCMMKTVDYTYSLGFGEMYRASKVLSKDVIGRDCHAKCPPLISPNLRLGRAMLDGENRSMIGGARGKTRVFEEIIVPMSKSYLIDEEEEDREHSIMGGSRNFFTPQTEDEINQEKLRERAKIRIDMDDYRREVNEQTLRMMHAQISPFLLNEHNPEVKSREFKYLQNARLVVENLCPSDYVPRNLLRGLMRMFKQLLWESTNHQLPHNERSDDSKFNRIMGILENCTSNITESERFLYYNYTGAYNYTGKNESDPSWPKPEFCPEPFIHGVYGKNLQGESTILHNITEEFQPYLKFNLSLVDFVIETAWKSVMIAHYQCSKSFNDTTASDFSIFFSQMELFFNDKIVKRWYDPVNVKNTLQVIDLIFPTYDLRRFAFGIDICMFAAQQYSEFGFNSRWIQRPKIPFILNELQQELYVLPGLDQPISTNDYAPKVSRKKRGIRMWNGKAKCMNHFMDPIERFGYQPSTGCKI